MECSVAYILCLIELLKRYHADHREKVSSWRLPLLPVVIHSIDCSMVSDPCIVCPHYKTNLEQCQAHVLKRHEKIRSLDFVQTCTRWRLIQFFVGEPVITSAAAAAERAVGASAAVSGEKLLRIIAVVGKSAVCFPDGTQ